jgi:hypothetical protein
MACSCDSCSSPRIIKTRTALFWRWLAQSRGETGDRVIPAPVRAVIVSVRNGLTDDEMPIETAGAWCDAWPDEVDQQALAELLGWGQAVECGGTSLA